MPLPTPAKNETEDQFIDRCMGDSTMTREYPDSSQRRGVCQSQWDRSKKRGEGRKRAKKHQIRRLVATAYETPWAITRAKLDAITDLLERRSSGHLTEQEIEARLAVFQAQSRYEPDDEDQPYRLTAAGVAIIPLYGVLTPRANLMTRYSGGTSVQEFAEAIHRAVEDDQVRAIVIDADSPGGSVLGIPEAAEQLRIAAERKPTVAVGTNQLCSAAYWIAAAAGELVASPSTMIGSLGIYTVHNDYSAADTVSGVRRTVTYAGPPQKLRGNPHETLNQEGRDSLRQEAEDTYQAMITDLERFRDLEIEAVTAKLGQRATLRAPDAVDVGLIDRVATLSQVVGELERGGSPPPAPGTPTLAANQIRNVNLSSQKEDPMDPRVMQALIARGLIAGDDDKRAAEAALTTWYAARGATVPESVDQIVADLAPPAADAASGVPTEPDAAISSQSGASSTPPAQTGTDQSAILAERSRICQIRDRGALLGLDESAINAAIDNGTSLEQFLVDATARQAADQRPLGRMETGQAQADKFAAATVEVLAVRCGLEASAEGRQVARDLQYASLVELCQETYRVQGHRLIGSREDVAQAALGDWEMARNLGADAPIHGPGSFPNILSVLANKILEGMPRFASTTYQRWAYRKPSVPDFKPTTLLRIGELGEMPEHIDGQDFEQATVSEEFEWIQVDSYGHEFGLTPVMIANDDLGAFAEAIADSQNAYDATINRLCCNVLTGNPTLVDGYALFDATNHGNNIAAGGGGVPSETELSDMRKLMRAQKGASGKRHLNLNPGFLLCPYTLETTTQKLLTATLQIYPTSSSGTEVFKYSVDYAVDPMLEDHSTAYWYLFAVGGRAIVYVFQTGYETVKRRDYYNPKNNCRTYQFEGRVAAAVNNYREVCRNEGS